MSQRKVIVLVGPTAVGKTDVSIDIAQSLPVEIISGDSMQVYRGMDIGTGKVTTSEKKGIPHYMIDIKQVGDDFSAADFQLLTNEYMDDIHARGKIPLIVGGTGLYIESVLYNFSFSHQKRDEKVTAMLEERLQKEGNHVLYNELMEIDETYAKKVHPNNHHRLIRGLEIYLTTEFTMTDILDQQQKQAKYNHLLLGLEMERPLLYERINRRVDSMMENGLLEEVAKFYEKGLEHTQAMKAIGYKELIPVLKGETELEEAVELLKRNSRRYAKRQFTYFRNKMNINWFEMTKDNHPNVTQEIVQACRTFLA